MRKYYVALTVNQVLFLTRKPKNNSGVSYVTFTNYKEAKNYFTATKKEMI